MKPYQSDSEDAEHRHREAAHFSQDETSHNAKDSSCPTPGENAGGSLGDRADIPPLRTLANPASGHGCPLHLYLCGDNKSNLHGPSKSSFFMASFGLHALVKPADLTCVQIDRFDSYGRKNRARATWDTKVWIPHFVLGTLEVDNISYQVCSLVHHLGNDAQSIRTPLRRRLRWQELVDL